MIAAITSEEMRLKNRPMWNRKDEDGCPLRTAILATVDLCFPALNEELSLSLSHAFA
jgi:hypothetical protein